MPGQLRPYNMPPFRHTAFTESKITIHYKYLYYIFLYIFHQGIFTLFHCGTATFHEFFLQNPFYSPIYAGIINVYVIQRIAIHSIKSPFGVLVDAIVF